MTTLGKRNSLTSSIAGCAEYWVLGAGERLIPFTQDLLYVAAGALWRCGRARLIEPVKIAIVASSGTIPIAQVALYVVLA